MQIKEVVTIEDTVRSQLYSLFISAARGDFEKIVNGEDKDEIKRIEKIFIKHFDDFATDAFNMGREYEKLKSITNK